LRALLIGSGLFILGQALIWIQTNGQFIWPWFKKNPMIVSIFFGSFVSYIFIYATRLLFEYFDGILWPTRFISFATGTVTFAILTYLLLGQGITLKTGISIMLAIAIILIQLFWK